ncbi:MAG: CaiB/BaiF CoA-transferase family protein [Gammaproteobacteria bacterium]|nr:CaiB/BaiF CoA-transferase family protein [Gammaproteobacteria bacterium]
MAEALKGIKVLDLSRILAGPWASQMLADCGAQVIKIERPNKGDDTRYWGPPFIKEKTSTQPPQAAYFHSTNRNKQSIAIDIQHKTGQQIIKDLVKNADVFIENFKVGTLARYGLDYPKLKLLNPNLIYCSITGFGQTGPSSERAGYDAMIQGEGGLMSITGVANGEPMKAGVALTDIMTGLYCSNAILAALMARNHIDKGQYIDIALLDVQVATLANQGLNYLATGNNPKRQGNAHPNIVPYQTFNTSDGIIMLAIGNDTQFRKFCQFVERPELADNPNFQTNEQRVINRESLIENLSKILLSQPTVWWVNELETLDIPCGPINTLQEVFNHSQIKHRNLVRKIPDNCSKQIYTIASPINLSETPLQYRSASPNLSEHCEKILSSELGYNSEKIQHLRENGIVS